MKSGNKIANDPQKVQTVQEQIDLKNKISKLRIENKKRYIYVCIV